MSATLRWALYELDLELGRVQAKARPVQIPKRTGERIGLGERPVDGQLARFTVFDRYDDGVWRPCGRGRRVKDLEAAARRAKARLVFNLIGMGPVETGSEGKTTGWEGTPPRQRAVALSLRAARYGQGAGSIVRPDDEKYTER